jgi:hypothetical protein
LKNKKNEAKVEGCPPSRCRGRLNRTFRKEVGHWEKFKTFPFRTLKVERRLAWLAILWLKKSQACDGGARA